MDWFLDNRNLRHERVRISGVFNLTEANFLGFRGKEANKIANIWLKLKHCFNRTSTKSYMVYASFFVLCFNLKKGEQDLRNTELELATIFRLNEYFIGEKVVG